MATATPTPNLKRISRICVLKCPEEGTIHTYGFPKDKIGRSVWLKQLGLTHVHKTAAVCNRHFSERMKPSPTSVKLTHWAIPDINLPEPVYNDDEDDYSDEFYLDEDDQNYTNNPPTSNGYSKNTKSNVQGNNTKGSKSSNIEDDYSNDPMIDPLDFNDMIGKRNNISHSKNNNNNGKRESDDTNLECEEMLEDDDDIDGYETNNSAAGSQTMGNRNSEHDEDTMSVPSETAEINSHFKRKLIASVRRRRILYDPTHPYFGNIEKKTGAWERIGKALKLDGKLCRELWLNMRYDYQNHVRSLRRWLSGESGQRERPRMHFENDLIFLWRYIPDKSTCDDIDDILTQPQRSDNTSSSIQEDKNLVVSNSEVTSNANKITDKSTTFVGNLIDAVRSYSELYDTLHHNYGDSKRRSIIWDAISNELQERATKCLFYWIQLQLRYEFEISLQINSYLVVKMQFLKKHILADEKSPYKRTTLLKNEWIDPHYKTEEQQYLLASMVSCKKTRPYVANVDCPFATVELLKVPCWKAVAKARSCKPLKCEITWIIMQIMYCELAEYRRKGCRLNDEWEFESIITNLRDTIVKIKPKTPTEQFTPTASSANKKNNINPVKINSFVEQNDDDIIPLNDTPPPPPTPTPTPPPPQPVLPPNTEISFKVPGDNPGDEERLVRYKLDIPLTELPEKTIVDVGTVYNDAHVVIIRLEKGSQIYLFTLEKRKELIGEVMARPIIFNEPCKPGKVSKLYMNDVASEVGYPFDVCLCFWEFIVEKLLFVDYDPSWRKCKESKWIPAPLPIFEKFQKYAESKNWNEYISVLSDFMQEIGNFPLIYSDLKINSSWNRRQCHTRDVSEVWTILARKFVVLENHKLIWDKFKQIFLLYMSEMELSMYNPWPPFWAPVFEKMKFLFEFKYSPKTPIYYVIRLRLNEEIFQSKQNAGSTLEQLDAVTNAKVIFRLLKENEYLEDFTWVNRARFISKMKSFPMLFDISHQEFGNKEAKLDAWQEMALLFHCTVGECHLIFQHLMKSFLIFRARDPNQVCRVNAKYWENMTYIYSCAFPNAIDPKSIRGRSFRASSNGSTIKLAEEYQAEISLVDAKPRLILKNVASAVNSLPAQLQASVTQHIQYIFSEYNRIPSDEIVVDV